MTIIVRTKSLLILGGLPVTWLFVNNSHQIEVVTVQEVELFVCTWLVDCFFYADPLAVDDMQATTTISHSRLQSLE